MNGFTNWLDGMVRRLCRWLNDVMPRGHPVALTGRRLAGLGNGFFLPLDRRLAPNVLMTWDNGNEKVHKSAAAKLVKGKAPAHESDPHFWAYCHMKGQPCVWCKGKNDLVPNNDPPDLSALGATLCPAGKTVGNAWYGCCDGPNGIRTIAFLDCCGHGWCVPNPFKKVTNWKEAKNWCFNQDNKPKAGTFGGHIGEGSYYCTVVVDNGECPD
jgi:hypothetical protein